MNDLFVGDNVENESQVFTVPDDSGSEGGDLLDPGQDQAAEQGEDIGDVQAPIESAQGEIYEENQQPALSDEMVFLQNDEIPVSTEEIPQSIILTSASSGVPNSDPEPVRQILYVPVKSSDESESQEAIDYSQYLEEIIGKLDTIAEIQADTNSGLGKVYGNCITIMTVCAAIFGLLAISILFSKVSL